MKLQLNQHIHMHTHCKIFTIMKVCNNIDFIFNFSLSFWFGSYKKSESIKKKKQ